MKRKTNPSQKGTGKRAVIEQQGENNLAYQYQEGRFNPVFVRPWSDNNASEPYQYGGRDSYSISPSGEGVPVIVTQGQP